LLVFNWYYGITGSDCRYRVVERDTHTEHTDIRHEIPARARLLDQILSGSCLFRLSSDQDFLALVLAIGAESRDPCVLHLAEKVIRWESARELGCGILPDHRSVDSSTTSSHSAGTEYIWPSRTSTAGEQYLYLCGCS
jgi:hypothetical protein